MSLIYLDEEKLDRIAQELAIIFVSEMYEIVNGRALIENNLGSKTKAVNYYKRDIIDAFLENKTKKKTYKLENFL